MKIQRNFRKLLRARQRKLGSCLCTGLDPLLEKLPEHLRTNSPGHEASDVLIWMMGIVDSTVPFTTLFKPQRAHWEAIPGGAAALQALVKYILVNYPTIPIFLDCKRGDIDRTQKQYQIAQFEIDGVDGMNFSPYMGEECMSNLINPDYLGRAIVGLCYTSNKTARKVQDVLMADGNPYWEFIAKNILEWAESLGVIENTGLVMAAAYENPKGSGTVYSKHLSRCRELVGDKLWFLIPGVGTQGGFIEQTIQAAWTGWGSIAINNSSGIIFASSGKDYKQAAAKVAKGMHLQMKAAIETKIAA